MSYKKKPLQVYLRDDQIKALRVVAEHRGESLAALVREGIDLLLDNLPTAEDPLLDLVGLFDSGHDDLAESHDQHLSRLINEEPDHEP